MSVQNYLDSAIAQLKINAEAPQPQTQDEYVEAIFRLVMSKKFRKYSLTEAYAAHIKNAIKENVEANQPINLTFLGGCYKLWRLDEAPESDWAELFAHIYYTRWVQPICNIYEPGVWFDFFLDDVIVSRIDNIPESDIEAYRVSRQRLLDFLKPYQPDNLNMTLTGISSLFKTKQDYEADLEEHVKKLSEELPGGLPVLSEVQIATADLNVKATPAQLADPKWREKVELIHSAYMSLKGETGYSTVSNKIRVFTQPLASGTCIAVGSTKDSIAKFWIGVGALRPQNESFRQIVLSPKQLDAASFDWQELKYDNLSGKNFSRIRVLK